MQVEVILAGVGGQGILTTGRILAKVLAGQGYNLTWVPSYGAEQRGGIAECGLVFAEQSVVDSPIVEQPAAALLASAGAVNRWLGRISPGGLAVCEKSAVAGREIPTGLRLVALDSTRVAIDLLGSEQFGAMILLGALVASTGWIPLEIMQKALVGMRNEAVNRNALEEGARLCLEI